MTLIQEKIAQAVSLLREFNLPCWLTFVRETGVNGDPVLPFLVPSDLTWPSAFIVTPDGQARAIVGRYDRQTVLDVGAYREVEGYVEGIKAPLVSYLRKLNPKTIAVNYSKDSEICDGLTHGMYLLLVDMLKEIGYQRRLVSAEPLLSALRERKTAEELKRMRRAIQVTEDIFRTVGSFLQPGRTERDVADLVSAEVAKAGVDYAWEPAHCPAVFAGPDTAEAHYGPTGRRIERGHVVNMDFGVKVDSYCSDLQRTWYVLRDKEKKAPPDVQHGFDTIVSAIEEARKTIRPGVLGHEVDAVARRVIAGAGFAEFPHALGHQVGRFAHDGTALLGPAWEKYGRRPFAPIEAGMVFTLEPRLLVPEHGTVTVEEMVVVSETGADYLSDPERELRLV
jgi:Xaa-Pro aminopeptidase